MGSKLDQRPLRYWARRHGGSGCLSPSKVGVGLLVFVAVVVHASPAPAAFLVGPTAQSSTFAYAAWTHAASAVGFAWLLPGERRLLAWVGAIVAMIVIVGLIVAWTSTSLRLRNRRLAQLVDERTAQLARANTALQDSNRQLTRLSVTDVLTGLKNRRYLDEQIRQDIAVLRRDHWAPGTETTGSDMRLVFFMVDIDHFKRINDEFSHAVGDCVLRQVADVLRTVVRESDLCIRWGGEEFLVVVQRAEADAGPHFAERVRAAVAGHTFITGEDGLVDVTCSVGFAFYPVFVDEPEWLDWGRVVNLADRCMYEAKKHGRNAWAGLMPGHRAPPGNVMEVLQSAFAVFPVPGRLPVRASWSG